MPRPLVASLPAALFCLKPPQIIQSASQWLTWPPPPSGSGWGLPAAAVPVASARLAPCRVVSFVPPSVHSIGSKTAITI